MSGTDMTLSRYGRDACPVCGRSIALLKSGKIHSHSGGRYACPGSGQYPKSADR